MALKRSQITLSDDEMQAFFDEERVVTIATIGPNGRPHLMPLWYVVDKGLIAGWTFGKSQKVRNLERVPQATLQIEAGRDRYQELRGVMLECDVEILRDQADVEAIGLALARRYARAAGGRRRLRRGAGGGAQAGAQARGAALHPDARGELGPPKARRGLLRLLAGPRRSSRRYRRPDSSHQPVDDRSRIVRIRLPLRRRDTVRSRGVVSCGLARPAATGDCALAGADLTRSRSPGVGAGGMRRPARESSPAVASAEGAAFVGLGLSLAAAAERTGDIALAVLAASVHRGHPVDDWAGVAGRPAEPPHVQRVAAGAQDGQTQQDDRERRSESGAPAPREDRGPRGLARLGHLVSC